MGCVRAVEALPEAKESDAVSRGGSKASGQDRRDGQDGTGRQETPEGGREEASPFTRPPSHAVVAEALRKRIALGGLEAGERLPTERELAGAFGAGRNTVRRALRQLAEEGLVVTTLGRSGGTRVAEPAPGAGTGAGERRAAAERAAVDAEFRATLRDYMEYRQAVEPLAARLAAERGATGDRRELVRLVEEPVGDLETYHRVDSRFHLAVAATGGNDVVRDAVARARAEMFIGGNALWLRSDWKVVYGESGDPGQVFRDEHEAVAHAVLAGDGERAEAAMRAHLEDSYCQFLRLLDHFARHA